MFHHDVKHTGLSPYNTSDNNGTLIWNFTTGDSISSSPVIDSNGTIYFGSWDNNLYAIYSNGTEKWNFITGADIYQSPAIGFDGTIYVGSNDDNLYAIYPNGTKKWNFQITQNIESSPTIGPDGIIYFGAGDYNLYAIYPNGTKKWNFTTGLEVETSPAIGSDGTIYFGSDDNKLYAIYPNATKKWSFTTGNRVYSSPAIGSDGTIYVGSRDGNLYAIYPNGTKNWSYSTGSWVVSSPAIDTDGIIYFGSDNDNLYAIYPNGTKKWSYLTGGGVKSSPAISSDGTIYIGSEDNNIYAINKNGTKKWDFKTGDLIYSSPAISSCGSIYVGSYDGKLYAIGIPLILSSGIVSPTIGNTSIFFNYSVNYLHINNIMPTYLNVNIDGINHSMNEVDTSDINYIDGKDYFLNITHLDIGVHTHRFYTSDGIISRSTSLVNKPVVYNTAPNITTDDNLTAIEDTYYEINYQYVDIDRENVAQVGTWNLSSNATWLSFNPTTAMLNGTPTNNDVGKYWVNISINDTMDMDFTNFTLTVLNENDDPIIETTDIEITYEDELYEVDYNATDIDSLISNQIWFLDTNATLWLDINPSTGIINGTPTNDEVGNYWVNVSVDDGDTGLAFTNYTLIVLNVNDRPEIITEDELIANANILYSVDYNATDIDSPLSQLTWSLNTNSTWLDLDTSTGVISGTPTISDVGWFNVNITVDDGDGGQDWHDFILTVISEGFENEPPKIITIDKVSITAGTSYNVIYEATDDRTPLESLIWSYDSNASWLSFNQITRTLSGNPTLSDAGWYWVNITVGDGDGGFDSHNFTLKVWATANEPPDILTDNDVNAVVDELYSVDYEAEDDRTPLDKLQWSLETNTSDWLDIDPKTGILSGIPKLKDVGSYWVKVSVFDGEDGWDFTNFTLWVTTEPITKLPPELINPSMTPSTGDTETMFTFSVDYSHPDGDLPDSIQVVIDGNANNMDSTNGHYEYSTKLSEGNHTYYFTTTLGDSVVNTNEYQTG
ncbi:MAG: PQQ-binding-like beta-propeller repeat protein, partial [Thermoplasmata archaeon]|nr:PQQ-binding-like beta-propeller repeat protein [Thermoplasmata archaeon]